MGQIDGLVLVAGEKLLGEQDMVVKAQVEVELAVGKTEHERRELAEKNEDE